MLFEFDWASKILTISLAPPPAQPDSVTIAGSVQEELGCPGDWQPDCASTDLTYDTEDVAWQGVFSIPAGDWEYKAALDGSWNENYGANATRDGANITLSLATGTDVKFYYSHATHWITDNVNSVIATVPGSFQSELGCAGADSNSSRVTLSASAMKSESISFSAFCSATTSDARILSNSALIHRRAAPIPRVCETVSDRVCRVPKPTSVSTSACIRPGDTAAANSRSTGCSWDGANSGNSASR